jgi:hypothetical protein
MSTECCHADDIFDNLDDYSCCNQMTECSVTN